MKNLFNAISTQLSAKVPSIKTVLLWNNQIEHNIAGSRDQKTYLRPAVFIEFIFGNTKNFSLGIKNIDVTVRFRFQLESQKFTRYQDLDFQDTFDAFAMGCRGTSSPAVFTTLQEVQTNLDTDYGSVNEPYVDYITSWRRTTGDQSATWISKSGVVKSVTVNKVATIP